MKNLAIVGYGFMGGMHAQIYELLPNAKLAAVVDLDTELTRKKLAEQGIEALVYPSLDALWGNVDVDAVDICSPSDYHEEHAVAAASAGKHLFIEKPLSLSLEKCQRIASAIEKAGVYCQVGQCIRFWPEYMALHEYLKKADSGLLKSLFLSRRAARPYYSKHNWLNDRSRSGGAAFDLHIHDSDFVLHLLGMPRAVFAKVSQGLSGPDHIFAQYNYDGINVYAEGGWDYPEQYGFRMAFEAIFENACIQYDSASDPSLTITVEGQATVDMAFEQPRVGESQNEEGNISSLGGYFNELKYFVDCLEAGKAPKIATVKQATDSVRLVLAELQSAEAGCIVEP